MQRPTGTGRLTVAMTRRWIAALVVVAAALLLAPVVLLLSAGLGTQGPPAASALPSPSVEQDALEPGLPEAIAWVYAPPPIAGVGEGAFVLQAGTLAGAAPLLDLEVPWVIDFNSDLLREPAVGPPIDASVVYVEDDGASSVIHRAQIAEGSHDVALAELSEVVWDIAVTPDNTVAYAAMTDRETREQDLGVMGIRLDGSGESELVMPPARVAVRGDILPVAFISFNVQLMISDDGRHLARRACAGFDGCETAVLDIASGAISPVPDGDINGMAAGFMVVTRCDGIGCRPHAVDLETGVSIELEGDDPVHVMSVNGRPVVVTKSSDANLGTSIDTIDILSGERRVLFRAERGAWAGVNVAAPHLTLAVPAGHIHVTQSTPLPEREGVAVVEMRHLDLLISVLGGRHTEIPSAPIRPLPGFTNQG
jgi:hypothetical protein